MSMRVGFRKILSRNSTPFLSRIEVVLVSLVINVLGLALPIALIQVYDRILPNEATGSVFLLGVGVTVALILDGVMRFSRSAILGSAGARFEHGMGSAAFQHMLSSDITEFEKSSTGEHLEQFNAVSIVRDHVTGQATLALIDLPFAFVYLGVIYFLAGNLALVPIGFFLSAMVVAMVMGAGIKRAARRKEEQEETNFTFLIKALSDYFTVKAVSLEKPLTKWFAFLEEKRVGLANRVERGTLFLKDLSAVASQASTVCVAGVGAFMVLNGEISVGVLAASTLLAGRGLQPLQAMTNYWTRSQSIQNAHRGLENIFKLSSEVAGDGDANIGSISTGVEGRLTLKNVSHRFGKDDSDVISNVNLDVSPGQMVAFVGPNNSGKSVLLMLAAGILNPSEGEVLLDGRPLGTYGSSALRRHVAFLPQHEVMFTGTILENITMFRSHLEPLAREAARMMELDEVIDAMPKGYDTRIGDGPQDSLSRGLAQRVAITRALVEQPKVLLFDEANSAVDFRGDASIRNILKQLHGHCTVLLVSHRPSILNEADRVIHIEDGRLEEDEPEMAADHG